MRLRTCLRLRGCACLRLRVYACLRAVDAATLPLAQAELNSAIRTFQQSADLETLANAAAITARLTKDTFGLVAFTMDSKGIPALCSVAQRAMVGPNDPQFDEADLEVAHERYQLLQRNPALRPLLTNTLTTLVHLSHYQPARASIQRYGGVEFASFALDRSEEELELGISLLQNLALESKAQTEIMRCHFMEVTGPAAATTGRTNARRRHPCCLTPLA